MPITVTIPVLDRTSSSFKTDLDTFFATTFPAFAGQANALAADVTTKQEMVTAAVGAVTVTVNEAMAAGLANAAANATTATENAGIATAQAVIASGKAGEAAASAATAAGLVESIAGGPVASVNGRSGPNVIGLAELTANTFTGPQTYSDQQSIGAMFKDCGLVVADKGESGTTLQTIDYTAGHEQVITATGPFTIAFSNWAPTGNKSILELECVDFGAFIVSWPSVLWVNPDKTTTTNFSTWLSNWGVSALPSSGSAFLKFTTRDAGATLYGAWA